VRRLAERLPLQFGTRNSEFGIARLCLSPAALGSDWVGLERSTVLFRDPANAGRRFIPLLLADCKRPLPAKVRADFRMRPLTNGFNFQSKVKPSDPAQHQCIFADHCQ
jgi:hypothetical protein